MESEVKYILQISNGMPLIEVRRPLLRKETGKLIKYMEFF